MGVKKSEVESSLVNAWSCFKRDEIADAESFASDAFHALVEAKDDGWDIEQPQGKDRLKFRDWFIMNPCRWFRRHGKDASEPHTIVDPLPKPKRKKMKKLIGVLVLSSVVGVSSNYFSDSFGGPTTVDRGQFAAVSQCDNCFAVRLSNVAVCADCGATTAIEKIAAPLTHRPLGWGYRVNDGWQFKDGSTLFDSEGEYVVPELVVKTRRM